MKLMDSFWKQYELDLQELRVSFLGWSLGYAREPKPEYLHLFLWDPQEEFCLINDKYGRAFVKRHVGSKTFYALNWFAFIFSYHLIISIFIKALNPIRILKR